MTFSAGKIVLGALIALAIVAAFVLFGSDDIRRPLAPAHAAAPSGQGAHDAATAKPANPLYYCPMHPFVTSNKPGTCRICGMDLVPAEKPEVEVPATETEGRTAIPLSATQRQLIGVQTGTVEKKTLSKKIRAVGRVAYDEKKLSTVNLRFGGWVEELIVKAVGEPVRKGDPLLRLYSPELLEAQRNYLLARESSKALGEKASPDARSLADETLKSARTRMQLWGLTDAQIKELEEKGEPQRLMTVYAPADGIVTMRNIVEGSAVEAGKDLYQIADLSTVWVEAEVYEPEIPLVAVGQDVQITMRDGTGAPLPGKVAYIYPYLNNETRTLRVRIEMANPEGKLRPGLYVIAQIVSPLGENLVVDSDAIIFTGERNLVFVDEGQGNLEPRNVTIGQSADGFTIITDGLAEGEQVVTSGNFLVDSESRLKSALKKSAAAAPVPAPEQKQPAGRESKGSMDGMKGMPAMPGM